MMNTHASEMPLNLLRIASATSGPAMAPQVSIARCNPNARPRNSAAVESAINASRADVRIDFPSRSAHRPTKNSGQPIANAASPMIGLLNAEIVYPAKTNGFRRRKRSDNAPLIHRSPLLIPSANPSTNPSTHGGARSVCTRNSGISGYSISDARSVKNETHPRDDVLSDAAFFEHVFLLAAGLYPVSP